MYAIYLTESEFKQNTEIDFIKRRKIFAKESIRKELLSNYIRKVSIKKN